MLHTLTVPCRYIDLTVQWKVIYSYLVEVARIQNRGSSVEKHLCNVRATKQTHHVLPCHRDRPIICSY